MIRRSGLPLLFVLPLIALLPANASFASGISDTPRAPRPAVEPAASGQAASGTGSGAASGQAVSGTGSGTASEQAASGAGAAAGLTKVPTDVKTLVSTGHRGEVLALEYDEERKLLFSAGEDGTVRVWQPSRRALLHRLQVSHFPLVMLTVDPSSPQVAVLETDGARSFAISVWDWESEKQRFRIELAQAPLFLRFSGSGGLLAYGQSRWEGLRIVHAGTGAPFAFHPEGFGIVSFAEVGPSEKTIMTYQPAGRIAYWDLASGSLLRDLASVPYLGAIRISRDRRFLVGSTGKEVVFVDLLTGAIRARAALTGALAADISPDGGELALTAGVGSTAVLSQWTLSGEVLTRRRDALLLSFTPLIPRYGGQGLFVASRGGELHWISESGESTLLSRDDLALVTGIAITAGRIALATKDRIWVFSSRLLTGARAAEGSSAGDGTPAIAAFSVVNPFEDTAGLSFFSSARLLIWPKGESSGPPLALDVPSRALQKAGGARNGGPLLELEAQPEGSPLAGTLLSLEQGGTVRLSDSATGAIRYESRLPGMYTIALAGPADLVGGRNAAISTEGSLLRINMQTGETVAIPTRALFTYEVLFDPAVQALYSIGVDRGGSTSLLRHSGPGFETETPIDRVDWEDLFATLTLDSSTGLLFSSLGSARISVWDAGALALMRFPDTARIPRIIRTRDGLLFALNRDSTVSVWDERGSHLVEISIFSDGEWCFQLADGRFSASSAGAGHLEVSIDGSPAPDKDAFRIP